MNKKRFWKAGSIFVGCETEYTELSESEQKKIGDMVCVRAFESIGWRKEKNKKTESLSSS